METNEKTPVQLNFNSITHLSETRRWTMFLSVIGFIFMGFCITLIPILLFSSGSALLGMTTTLPLILISILYIFPIYFLMKFSVNSKKAIINSDSQSLEISLKFLKYHYRFMGIFVISMVAIYIIAGAVLLVTTVF